MHVERPNRMSYIQVRTSANSWAVGFEIRFKTKQIVPSHNSVYDWPPFGEYPPTCLRVLDDDTMAIARAVYDGESPVEPLLDRLSELGVAVADELIALMRPVA